MKQIAVGPNSAFEARQSLFSALEAIFDARFLPEGGDAHGASLDAEIRFEGVPALTAVRSRTLAFPALDDDAVREREVVFGDVDEVDSRLRGRRLVDSKTRVGSLE